MQWFLCIFLVPIDGRKSMGTTDGEPLIVGAWRGVAQFSA